MHSSYANKGDVCSRPKAAIALDITPDSALAFQTENLALTRLDHVAGPGEGGDWRIVTVNTLPK